MKDNLNNSKELTEKVKALEQELEKYKNLVAQNDSFNKQIQVSKNLYESLIDSLPQNFFQKDTEGKFTLANPNFCKSLGIPLKDVIGKTDYDFYPKELADKYRNDDKKVIQKGEVFEDIEEHKLVDGKTIYVHVLKIPVFDNSHKAVGLQCIFWDVQKFSQALSESEIRYRKLIESANDAIISIDVKSGKIIDANKKAESLTGFLLKELIGLHYLVLHPKEDKDEYIKIFNNTVQVDASINYDLFVCNQNGKKIPVSISASVTDLGNKKVFQGIYQDFTLIKDAEEKERNFQAQLIQSEKLSSIGLLGAGVAHELNSPLTGILTFLRLRRKDTEPNSKEYMKLTAMVEAAEHMGKIISDLTEFSRGSNNEFSLLSLNDVIDSTLSFSSLSLTKQGIEIRREYENDLLKVLGDRSKLQQVIINMIANAKNAMPDGGVLIIKTYNSNDNKEVYMEFIDTGVGIEENALDLIFEPFFTTRIESGGAGLGLFVSKGIINTHKGKIQVESKLNVGTKFKIILPMSE